MQHRRRHMQMFFRRLKVQATRQPLAVILGADVVLQTGVLMRLIPMIEQANAGMAVFDGANLAQAIKDMGVSKEVLATAEKTWETTAEVLARTEDVLQATGYGNALPPAMSLAFSAAGDASGGPLSDIVADSGATQMNFDDFLKLTKVGASIIERGGLENVTLADGIGLYDTMFGSYVSVPEKQRAARGYSEASTKQAMEYNWETMKELPDHAKEIADLAESARAMASTDGNLRGAQAIDTLAVLQNSRLLAKLMQTITVNENQRLSREQEARSQDGTWTNPDAPAGTNATGGGNGEVDGLPWLKSPGSAAAGGTGVEKANAPQGNKDWVNPDEVRNALGG